jgi:Domain of unknown function (DUF4349)/Putative zinc-finger
MKMSTPHLIEQEEVMAYLDGELSVDRAAVAMSHLERCPECQSLAAGLRSVSQKLMTWEIEAPGSGIKQALAAEFEQRAPTPVTKPQRKGVTVRRWMWAGAFAAICLAGLSISSIQERMSRRQQEATGLSAPSSNLEYFYTPPSSKTIAAPAAPPPPPPSGAPVQGKEYDRLQQFAEARKAPTNLPLNGRQINRLLKLEPGVLPDHAAPTGPLIIRTAGLTLTAKNFDDSRARLDDILRRHRGYIGDLNVNSPTGSGRSFTATLRIPADQLDAALADLKSLGRVETESQNGQDVTSQYVDLEARLGNARHTEERLTALLRERTGKLSDVLAVENEISRVRGEIEQMEAERKNLSSQVTFATINATVNENYQAQLQVVPVSTATQVRNAAVEGYRTMVDGVVGAILFVFSYAPTLILWGLILLFPLRAVWKRVVRPRIS